ncbi:hypothetical protein EJN23_18285 [Salmonella enterica]|nr:hypothetical protein [Salmonella enterica]
MEQFDAINVLRTGLWISIPLLAFGIIILRLSDKKYLYPVMYPILTACISVLLYEEVKAGHAVMNAGSYSHWFNLIWAVAVISGIISLPWLYIFSVLKKNGLLWGAKNS